MSDTQPIPFSAGQASGYDELAGTSPAFVNALVEGEGFRARPGVRAWSEFPTGAASTNSVVAMEIFNGKIIFATSDRKLFAWVGDGDVRDLSTGGVTSTLDGTAPPRIVANGSALCVIAGGGAPQKITPALVSERLAGSPPEFTDIVAISRRIVGMIADSGAFYWSGILDSGAEDWDTGIEFREAEAKPDHNVAVMDLERELWVWGAKTTQIYVPDEEQTFSPTLSPEIGSAAARSGIRWENRAAWLDNLKQFRLTDGRARGAESIISGPIAKTLRRLETVSDCWGARVSIDQHDILMWSMPTEGRTFVYEPATSAWSEFRRFAGGRWRPIAITSYLHWEERNLHLVGLSNGQIAELSFDAYDDLGDPLKWVARTGFIDRGTNRSKDPVVASFRFRRGEASSATATVSAAWRDDLGPWEAPLRYTLGTAGEYDPLMEVRPAGAPYDQRQWELSSTAAEAAVMTSAREEFNVLEA